MSNFALSLSILGDPGFQSIGYNRKNAVTKKPYLKYTKGICRKLFDVTFDRRADTYFEGRYFSLIFCPTSIHPFSSSVAMQPTFWAR